MELVVAVRELPNTPGIKNIIILNVCHFPGDVALLNLGLSDEEYTYMSSDVDLAIHAAASVNLVYPYAVSYASPIVWNKFNNALN